VAFGALVYIVSFQLTEGTFLAFSWVHLGLIACAVAVYSANGEISAEATAVAGPQ